MRNYHKNISNNDNHKNYNIPLREVNTNRKNLDSSKHNKNYKNVEIIGDSLLNGIVEKKLSKEGNVKVRKFPGCSSDDLLHHIIPTINKKPDIIICHVGSNDITNNIDTITNYEKIINKIKKTSSNTKLTISAQSNQFQFYSSLNKHVSLFSIYE